MNTKKTIVVAWAPPSQHDSARRAIALHLSHGVQRRLTSGLPNGVAPAPQDTRTSLS